MCTAGMALTTMIMMIGDTPEYNVRAQCLPSVEGGQGVSLEVCWPARRRYDHQDHDVCRGYHQDHLARRGYDHHCYACDDEDGSDSGQGSNNGYDEDKGGLRIIGT